MVSRLFGFAKISVAEFFLMQYLIKNKMSIIPSPIQCGNRFVTSNLYNAISIPIAQATKAHTSPKMIKK